MLSNTSPLRQVIGLSPLGICLFLMLPFLQTDSVCAQGGNMGGFGTLGGVEPTGQYPPQEYYIALKIYRSGDLSAAIDAFEASLRGSRRSIRGRWIDSIPSLAMLAECNWHLGNVPGAREYIDQVFAIAIANRGWLGRVEWQSVMQSGAQRSTPSYLWPEAANIRLVPTSDNVTFIAGEQMSEALLRAGGEIEERNLRPMDIVEVARGLAIASYRRRMILGQLSDQDPAAQGLIGATKYPAGLQSPLARTLIGAMRTTEYFSNYDDKRAVEVGSQNSTFGGAAHPLSALAMLTQTSAMAGSQQVDAVLPLAMNTVHTAAALEQPEFIGEALQLAAGCANPSQAAMVRQAASTVATAMIRKSRLAAFHCLVAGADASITAGDLASATTMLSQARSLGSRRDVTLPRISAYGSYVTARLAAANGASVGMAQGTDFDEAIGQIRNFALNHRVRSRSLISMPRIYQMGILRQSIGKSLGGNTSDALLKTYCLDPPIAVWRRDAVDGLATVMLDRSIAHMARINLAASGGYGKPLLQASDMMLGARFNQRLPLGGRIAQIRALAGFEDSALEKPVVEFRNKLGREMADLRAASLAAGQGDPALADALEAKACYLALSRTPLPQVVPPLLDEQRPEAKLPERTGLLTFTIAGNKLLATLAADGKVAMWTVGGSARLPSLIGRLLKGIGVGKSRGNRLPTDDSWREVAVAIRRQLIPDDSVLSAARFDELIIVPDGALWYLPFEILPELEEDSELLGDRIAIRYAATPGLAIKPVASPPISRAIGLSASKFFAPRDLEHNESIVQSLVDVVNDPVRLPESVETPTSLLADKVGHLVVAAPRRANPQNPLMLSVAPYDENSPYGSLAAWMRFPSPGPRTAVMFGLRTPLDEGKVGNGDEIFMTLCALQASGVRSVLVSRWAVGGESSAIALRELLQELPFTGLNAAWARAKAVLRRSELDPAGEPLLIQAEHDLEGLTGDQPLFWSGYIVSSPNHPSAD